jgi:excinuclease ABC subunit C
MQNIKSFLSNLTHQPGVYQMLGENGKILYVGKARNLKKRVTSYFSKQQQDPKTQALLKHVKDISIIVTHSENEALILECNLIKEHQPHYNILFRDDKSYPYILMTTDQTYPRIDFSRDQKKRKGQYFGPYPHATSIRETINLIQKLFRIRTCTDSFFAARVRPCLLYQIGRCSGPCTEMISAEDYQNNVHFAVLFLQGENKQLLTELTEKMEAASETLNYELAAKLRDQIIKLRQLQERQYVSSEHGDADVIGIAVTSGLVCIQMLVIRGGRILGSRSFFPATPAHSVNAEILSSFIAQHYLDATEEIPKEIILNESLPDSDWLANALTERAQHKVSISARVRGERKKWLDIANNSAKQSIASQLYVKTNLKERFVSLQKVLDLKHLPKRIECFDISHSMGEATVGSCVVFDNNGPVKSDYRRFNISDITPGDDVAAMRQTVMRRYKRTQKEEGIFPEIVLIDGGVTQLSAAHKVLTELEIKSILLIGVSKGVTRKPGFETLHFIDQPPVHLPSDSLALHLIQQIRDEAHRFAITGHRARRDKKRKTSVLESIPGIGPKRRRELLRYFGGIQAINRASLDELEKVPGMSKSLAERVFSALHNVTV